MPYRIAVTFDIPDQGDSPTTQTAAIAFRALNDVEEVIGRLNGDTQYDDVEWYGFDRDHDELTTNSWTYSDEEKLNELIWSWREARAKDDGEFDLVEWVDGEADDANQATRILREFDKREPVEKLQSDNRSLVNQAIGCVAALHSMIYNPDDKSPAEPKLGELEQLLRAIRF